MLRLLPFLLAFSALSAGCDTSAVGEVPGTFSLTIEAQAGASSLQGVALAGTAADLPDARIPSEGAGFAVVMAEGSITQPSPSGRALVIGWQADTPPPVGTYPLALEEGSGPRAIAVYYASGAEVYLATSGTVTVEAVSQRVFRGRVEMEAAPGGVVGGEGGITLRGTFSAARAGG